MSKTIVNGLSTSRGVTSSPYAKGWYKFSVKEAEQGESKNGNLQFVFRKEILEGPKQERKVEGGKFTSFFTISEAEFTVDKLRDFVDACGLRISSDDGFDPQKCVGKVVWGLMEHEKYEGKTRAKVQKFENEEFDPSASPAAVTDDED
jgi:hypothetical protein